MEKRQAWTGQGPSGGVRDFAPLAAANRLPDADFDAVVHPLHVAVAEQRVNTGCVAAAQGDVQGQAVPPVVRAIAMRQATSAIDVGIVGRPKVVVHGMPRRP